MKSRTTRIYLFLALPFLSGCAASVDERVVTGPSVPEAVIALAAPYQDISTARLVPEDGCYWYEHVGPVETTLLPLRNAEGRPICAG